MAGDEEKCRMHRPTVLMAEKFVERRKNSVDAEFEDVGINEKQLAERLKEVMEELRRENNPEQIEKRGGRMGRIFASLSDDEKKHEEKFNNPSFSSTIDEKSIENKDGNENWMERNETLFDERIIDDSIISVFSCSSFEKEKKKMHFPFSD
jgi:hypothetical protein